MQDRPQTNRFAIAVISFLVVGCLYLIGRGIVLHEASAALGLVFLMTSFILGIAVFLTPENESRVRDERAKKKPGLRDAA